MPAACIYLVEDDEDVRRATRLLLEVHGYVVQEFVDGETMLALTGGRGADCLILDIRLPGMSGIELLDVVRARGITTPAVLATAGVANLRPDADASHVLIKPYDTGELLALLSRLTHAG